MKDNTATNKDKHAIVVKPNNDLTSYTKSTWAEVTSKMLSPKLEKIPVSKTVLTKNGNGYLLFPNSKNRDDAENCLKNDFKLESQTKTPKLIYPKITIYDIDSDTYNNHNLKELKSAILLKNENLRSLVEEHNNTFEILFTSERKSEKIFAVAKVDPAIRTSIMKNYNNLFIGLSSCKVSDRIHLI